MAGIFNLFGDSTEVVKIPTKFGSFGSNSNSTLKLKNVGAPGATPGKIFGPKPKGLSIRSTSDLNIRPSISQSFDVKKGGLQTDKFLLKPKEIYGKSTSPIKQKSPIKLKSPKKLFENPPPIVISPNAKAETIEKTEELVFKKPKTPRNSRKRDMNYREPEVLAPIGDIDIELFDLTGQNFLKSCKNKYFLVDEDEGFLTDNEPVPVVVEEIQSRESVSEDMEVALPGIESIPDSDDTSN